MRSLRWAAALLVGMGSAPYGLDTRVPVGPYLDGRVQPWPALLSETGAFADVATLAPAASLVPFDLNTPLWSDGAVKSRWIAVPSGEAVGFAPTGEWTFPEGTVLVKHFELPVDDTDPSVRKRLETRFLIRDPSGGVAGATYRWRDDGSEADLLPDGAADEGLSETISIRTASGSRSQTWYYPSRADCLRCHNPAAGYVLGVKTRQLNRPFRYPSTGVTDLQLRTWNHLGLFSPAIPESDLGGFTRMVAVTDARASLENRVRSYVDANCASCHRPGFMSHSSFDARYDTPLAAQGIVDGPVLNTLGISGARVVVPGDVGRSLLHYRSSGVGYPRQMPPFARNTVDERAVAVMASWIDRLDDPPSDGGGSSGGGCGATGLEIVVLLLFRLRRDPPGGRGTIPIPDPRFAIPISLPACLHWRRSS